MSDKTIIIKKLFKFNAKGKFKVNILDLIQATGLSAKRIKNVMVKLEKLKMVEAVRNDG